MDDQFKDGFERMLSDMGEPPAWDQVSTQNAATERAVSSNRGWLVAAGAFALTLVVVGSVVVVGSRDSAPVAAEMIDYVKLEWTQNIELVCDGLETVDNEGFSSATIEIWGPNNEGFLVLDVTTPDGTTETQTIRYDAKTGATHGIWIPSTSNASGDFDYRSTYRVAQCSTSRTNGDSSWSVSDPPIFTFGFWYGPFIGFPEQNRGGDPWDISELVGREPRLSHDQWRGIPVEVYGRSSSDTDVFPEFSSVHSSESEAWVDPMERRLERRVQRWQDDVLGGYATFVSVVERRRVAADAVSFSTEGMARTFDRSLSDDSEVVTETTTSLPLGPQDTPAYNAYLVWLNQLGLNQDDLDMWVDRLDWICGIGWSPLPSDTPMIDAAGSFVTEDTELSVRSDGSIPSAVEAAESLWTIVADPRSCPARFKSSLDEVRDIDPTSIDSVDDIESALATVRSARTSAKDTEFEDMVIEFNETILSSDMVSSMERSRRSVFIDSSRAHKVSETKAVMTLLELEMALLSRQLELKGLEVGAPPVITLGGAQIIYSRSADIRLQGSVDQPVQVFVLEQEVLTHTDPSGRTTFDGEISLVGEGEHEIWITASNEQDQVATIPITVVVDPGLEVVFGYVLGLETTDGLTLMVYDAAEWFTGDDAVAAAVADGVVPEDGSLDTDFYIRKPDEAHPSSKSVATETVIALQACWPAGGPCIAVETVDVAGFEALLSDPSSAVDEYGWHWYGDGGLPFWLTIDDDVVVQVEEQYLP